LFLSGFLALVKSRWPGKVGEKHRVQAITIGFPEDTESPDAPDRFLLRKAAE
jgi:hypothetical protein